MKLNKRSTLFLILVAILLMVGAISVIRQRNFTSNWYQKQNIISCSSPFELKKGDILARPNWSWLPGSIGIPGGRKYGHVGVVVEGATGNTIEETLKKARIVEALFFDQKTKEFVTDKKKQLREESAWTSFGSKFKGMRYRLRLPMSVQQSDTICSFLSSQIGASYNILSLKRNNTIFSKGKPSDIKRDSWHCATLTWVAFHSFLKLDIDGNGGLLIYPGDIIGSDLFDGKDERVCF